VTTGVFGRSTRPPHRPPSDDPLPLLHRNARVRRLRLDDLRRFQAYRSDPDVARYQGWAAMSDADAERFLAAMAETPLFRPGEWHQLAIAEVDSDALLGDMGVHVARDGSEAELGFTLARAAQRKGIATCAAEAAIKLLRERTAVARIVGVTDARNEPSVRLLTRVGMRQVASRETMFRGEPCVELVFAMAR
jgi:RimJ/RimL family protein N-acetyltransferase